MSRRNYYCFSLVLLFFLAFFILPGLALPEKPSVSAIDPYFVTEIERVWSFLQTRQKHPELLLQMAILLEESDQEQQATKWYAEAKALNLPDDELEKLNQKIRRQYNFALLPLIRPELNPETPADLQEKPDLSVLPEAAALAAEERGQMELAAEEYYRLFRRSKKADYLALAAERYLWANQSRKALPLLVQLLNLRPKDGKLLQQLAEISSWHGDFAAAADYLEQALGKKYSRSLNKKLIFAVYAIPDSARCESLARQYLEKYPDDVKIKGFLAQLLLEMNRADEALPMVENIDPAKLDTLQIESFIPLFFARRNFGQVLKFCSLLEKRKISVISRLKTYFFKAAVLIEEKQYQSAEEQIKKGEKLLGIRELRLSANEKLELNHDFMLLKAAIIKESPQQNGLVELYQKILELNPQQFDALVFLGEDFRRRDDLTAAEGMFARALAIAPDDRYLLWTMADIVRRRGNIYRARVLMEKLAALPGFEDEALLLELWQMTSAWKKLADHISLHRERLLPEYEMIYLDALLNLGHFPEAAAILTSRLQANPFDEIAQQQFEKIAPRVPDLWQSYVNSKNQLIDLYHQNLVASITREISKNPSDKNLLRQRARFFGYMNQPLRALQDLKLIMSENPDEIELLEESAGLAEWGGDSNQALKIRRRLAELVPENASNAVALSSLAFSRRQFVAAEKWLKLGSSMQYQQSRRYFYTAMPVLLQAGKYVQACSLLEEMRKTVSSYPEDKDFSRFVDENARMLRRDYGPLYRAGFNFLHDTDNVALANLSLFSRFSVKDNSFLQISLEDLAMTRNNQPGVRSRDIRFSLNRKQAQRQMTFSLPLMLQNAEKVRLFLPGFSYRQQGESHESGFNFSQLALRDTPEALRQGLFSNNAEVFFRKKTGERTWLQGNAGFKRNSAGYSGTFAGFSVEKAVSFAPFRSLRYSFTTEDNQSENSDIFYLEDFIQSHTFAWSGQSDFFHPGRFFDMINWDVFAGINNRSETFHGASVRFENQLNKKYYLSAFASYYASENNRFTQADGYENWNYGLAVEMREW